MVEAQECAPVPVDPLAVARKIALASSEEGEGDHFMLAAVINGHMVGHLCIERVRYWYAPDREFLCDWGFYVLPQHRNGDAGQALLEEAIRIATLADLDLVICIHNPRRRRGAAGKVASLIGYTPRGALYRFAESSSSLAK